MAILRWASIFAYRMRFSRTFAASTRFALALFGVIAALLAGAGRAFAETIPGPPLPVPAGEARAFCPLPASTGGSAAGFAAGAVIVAIAARQRRDLPS
jgi:hypothetical protein